MKLTLLALAVTATLTLRAAAAPTNSAHLAKAQHLVALAFSGELFVADTVRLCDAVAKTQSTEIALDNATAGRAADTPPSAPAHFDAPALHASFAAALSPVAAPYDAAIARGFAKTFTDAQMDAMLAFLDSPEGRAAQAAHRAYNEAQAARRGAHPFYDDPGTEAPPYKPSAAEAAFTASPAGQALTRHDDEIGDEIDLAIGPLMSPALRKAEADYCAHHPCAAPERLVFNKLAAVWGGSPPPP